MNRQPLTDGTDRWFDLDKAEKFEENVWWDGNNHISKATGDQFVHEALYRTDSGKWVLNHWSQWQGSGESLTEVSDKEAARWLIRNEYDEEDIPDEILKLVKEHIDQLEI